MRYALLALLALLALSCAADPALLPDASGVPDAGPCGGACRAGTVCAAGACVRADAGARLDAGTDVGPMDAGPTIEERPATDVVTIDAGVDVLDDVTVDAPGVAVDMLRENMLDVADTAPDVATDAVTCDATVANDPTNCGACGAVCETGARCIRGRCAGVLLTGFSGLSGFGTPEHCLPPNDDGTFRIGDAGAPVAISVLAAIPEGLRFYGTTHTSLFVNTNGNLTFVASNPSHVRDALPFTSRTPMIAPWSADVDTTGGGQPTRNMICYATTPNRFVVTWHDVGRFSAGTDLLDSFQVIITGRSDVAPGAFDIDFRYARCEWTFGMATGAMEPAQAGFNAGDGVRFLALPGSRTPSVADLCTTSNVGIPGVWKFESRAAVTAVTR